MAKDDVFVVMYEILAYLYDCMKKGEQVNTNMIAHDGHVLSIPYAYWADVMNMLAANGYVEGVKVNKDIVGNLNIDMRDPKITMAGVEFMQENSMMRKALDVLKEAKNILPFI